ncbi:hypothetical protein CB0940_02282 [Cercospora beticola]|uniref:Apple domain-containing protein n=1 Tax=Cercospora beticola TaxID=122368 RepID=A0A2G5I1N9_CERBT|nr:hypothetical protein CB0940_02282 [Cercospora beticola]PIA98704.1 hypothetical protein CB0940_02282 [Cercospora beticola]WPA99402.1 hypothetical protein RHO25_004019 [Cercospora beticola]CAK1362478.1 unnamed protein product [Cercospora beticola]
MRGRHSLFFQAFALFIPHGGAQWLNTFSCPANNNTFVTDSTGGNYRITCGADPNPNGGTNTLAVASWNECFDTCTLNATCTAFTYLGVALGNGRGTCNFKARWNGGNNLRDRNWDNRYIGAVRQVVSAQNPTCPAVDGRYVTDDTGAQYLVSCGGDTSPTTAISSSSVPNFNDCFISCSNNPSCVAWTYRGGVNGLGTGTCSLKANQPGGAQFVPSTSSYVSGIRVAPVPPSSSNNFACASGSTTYTDTNGVAYVTRCGDETLPFAAVSQQPGSNANDCWAACSSNAACTGWTYRRNDFVSTTAGAGTCFYKGANTGGTGNGFYTRNNTLMISAIKAANYDPAQNGPRPNSFSCPEVDGTVVTDVDGGQYRMRCGFDTNPSDTASTLYITTSTTFNACYRSCSSNSTCGGFTWNAITTTGLCYFKAAPVFRSGTYDARLISAIRATPITNFTCPAVNGTVVTDLNNVQYRIKCYDDTTPTDPALTIYQTSATNWNECFASCSANATCSAFNYNAGTSTCFYKTGPAGYRNFRNPNQDFVAAVRIVSQNNYTCSAGQRTLYSDVRGTLYITSCGDDTTPPDTLSQQVVGYGGINDCWDSCSTNTACAGMTFNGNSYSNGIGGGTCVYKGSTANGTPNSFVAANNPLLASSLKLARYAPLTSSYTCPAQQDLSTVTDANTGLPYVLRCGGDTAGTAFATFNATSGFNDCITQCTADTRCTTWTYTGATNGAGPGTCALKSSNSTGFTPATGAGSQNRVAGIQQRAYDGSNGAIAATTVFPPAATQVATQIILVTTTILQPVPTTILSTISRLTTITSSVTVTATNIATLPDTTLRVTSVQVVPTTIATIQAITITVSTITTQTIVTVIPTTIVQTLSAATTNLLATGINTATTTLRAVVTVTPVQSVQPTYTVTG